MDNNHYGEHGNVAIIIMIITGVFGFIADVHVTLKDLSLIVSTIAGLMAIRYYYYSTKKQKK